MDTVPHSYRRHRFPPEVISHAVWLYHRFCLSLRDVEDLLAERGVIVSYEAIRSWCAKFGPEYARKARRRQGRLSDIWFLDELFVTIQGQRHYLWRAVDQDGDVIDILVQRRRNASAARRFFRKLLKGQGMEPRRLVTDKLKSYSAALFRVVIVRMRWHAPTIAYVERRTTEGLSKKEIIRCLKRYVAREVYNLLPPPRDNEKALSRACDL